MFADVLGHLAVRHAAVGFALGEEARVEALVVGVERAVELEVAALKIIEAGVVNAPFAEFLHGVEV